MYATFAGKWKAYTFFPFFSFLLTLKSSVKTVASIFDRSFERVIDICKVCFFDMMHKGGVWGTMKEQGLVWTKRLKSSA